MDIGRAFSFVFEDEEWLKKIAIGGLIVLIPIAGWLAISGYMVETARNVMNGNPTPLPDWSDFGDKILKGLYVFLIGLGYGLVIFIPFLIVRLIVTMVVATDEETTAAVNLCFAPIQMIISLVLNLVLLPAFGRYIQEDRLGAAFQVSEVIATLRHSLKPWLMMLLVYILAGIVGSLGLIACLIGVLFTMVYSQAIIGHAMGQTLAQLRGSVGAPTVDLRV